MNIEKKKNFLINVAYVSVIFTIFYLLYQYILPIVVPFIIGLLVAYIIVKISKKLKIDSKFTRIILTILFYVLFGLIITFLIIKGITFLKDIVVLLPDLYETQIAPTFTYLYEEVMDLLSETDPSIYNTIEQIWMNLLSYLSELVSVVSKLAVNIVSSTATAIPSVFLSTLMMIISSVFFALDYEKVIEFYHQNIDSKWKKRINEVRYYVMNTLLVVLRSYILIMMLTFTELSILFMIFGISNSFLWATIIAIFDIMPVLGSGGVLLPWAIIDIVLGNYIEGIKLVAIYGIITVVRQYVEPRIVGAQLGLHPIISLISMFIGLKLFGIIGMFGFPVSISFFWKKYCVKAQ